MQKANIESPRKEKWCFLLFHARCELNFRDAAILKPLACKTLCCHFILSRTELQNSRKRNATSVLFEIFRQSSLSFCNLDLLTRTKHSFCVRFFFKTTPHSYTHQRPRLTGVLNLTSKKSCEILCWSLPWGICAWLCLTTSTGDMLKFRMLRGVVGAVCVLRSANLCPIFLSWSVQFAAFIGQLLPQWMVRFKETGKDANSPILACSRDWFPDVTLAICWMHFTPFVFIWPQFDSYF